MDALDTAHMADSEVRAEKFYRRSFDTVLPEDVKAALMGFTCALNVVDVLLAGDVGEASAATVLKLRYITLHHVLSSLRKLAEQYASHLQPPTRSLLNDILTDPTSLLLMQAHAGFRNTLVHYRPEQRLENQLSVQLPLYGLADAYFPGRNFTTLRTMVARHTAYVAQRMEAWSRG
ncbi:hypothetical protein [Streptomyces sp. NPDC058457]|uniref:hypothetical protein n=1 Tax=Streptomyces sp. NPDC058457 TaxID=3346507 RepID=UPI003658C029